MIKMNELLDIAIEKDASDLHLINGLVPMMRVKRELTQIIDQKLSESDLYEIYDYFVRGNIDKDEIYRSTKRLDCSYEYKNIRLRVNISSFEDLPIFTLRIIKNELPSFDDLGVPEIVKRMTFQPQGLILVTGKTNSGKTTTLNALINEINETQNKKILTLEKPIEYKHTSKKSIIVQKEVGQGGDVKDFRDGVINALREDCDILVIRRNKR